MVQDFKKPQIVTRRSGMSMAPNSVFKVKFRGITLHVTTPFSIGGTKKVILKKDYSFCLMVEASNHGYVLHTRRIHVTPYTIRYDMISDLLE
jgi:hypothetical protein